MVVAVVECAWLARGWGWGVYGVDVEGGWGGSTQF